MANPNGHLETLQPWQGQWRSGKTRTIRVPIALADRVLAHARQLDENHVTQVNEVAEVVSEVVAVLEAIASSPSAAKLSKKVKQQLQEEAIEKLKALVTSE